MRKLSYSRILQEHDALNCAPELATNEIKYTEQKTDNTEGAEFPSILQAPCRTDTNTGYYDNSLSQGKFGPVFQLSTTACIISDSTSDSTTP